MKGKIKEYALEGIEYLLTSLYSIAIISILVNYLSFALSGVVGITISYLLRNHYTAYVRFTSMYLFWLYIFMEYSRYINGDPYLISQIIQLTYLFICYVFISKVKEKKTVWH